ncbi:MAG: hypothetical protein R3F61_09965 [Myxococcota bacterium]
MTRAVAALTIGLALACGGGSTGFKHVATGELTLELSGAMSGTLRPGAMTPTEMDANVGLYDPGPPYPTPPDGRWVAESITHEAQQSSPWQLEVDAMETALEWTGGCGTASPDLHAPISVFVFDEGGTVSVAMLVPLSDSRTVAAVGEPGSSLRDRDSGSAQFEGRGPGTIGDHGTIDIEGTWKLGWCGSPGGAETVVGPGTVRISWTVDRATERTYEAPPRRAF